MFHTLCLFSGPKSESLETLSEKLSVPDLLANSSDLQANPIRFVFIDSTWLQAQKMLNHPVLSNVKQIKLEKKKTMFWRYQTGQSDEHLATVEAIYHLLVDYQTKVLKKPYFGEFDNLLFLFKFMYEKIHLTYSKAENKK